MQLFLVRHAEAVEHGSAGSDAARELTPRGAARFRECVRGLAHLEVRLGRVLTSPLVRARQTADLLLPLGEESLVPEVCEELAAPPSPGLLQRLAGETVALVGHEPWIGALAGLLATGAPEAALPMKKGAVAWLEGHPSFGAMHLIAFLPPRVLRRLGA